MQIIKITLFISLINLNFSKISHAQGSHSETGNASYYASKFHGKKTASGEIYNRNLLTAAHNTLPFNTYVKVTNLTNKKSVIVKINDRGPFSKKRIIDLSKAAAVKIDMIQCGVAKVKIEVVDSKEKNEPETNSGKPNTVEKKISLKPGKTYKASGSEVTLKGYGVQVASFSDEEKLYNEIEKLSDKTKNLYIEVSIVKSKKVYRIISGNFSDKKSAESELKKLKAAGYKGFVKKFN